MTLEADLDVCVLEQLFEGFTQTQKIRCRNEAGFLYFIARVRINEWFSQMSVFAKLLNHGARYPTRLIDIGILEQDTNVYQPCRDLTGQIHRQVQATLCKLKGKYGKEHQWVQVQYSHLLPTGNTSPPARFYGLPKIHKANCPLRPIVSACGMSTYNLAKYLTTILKVYTGHTSSFVKDSKDLTDKLKTLKIQENEEMVSFDVSALFTSIQVDQALEVINRLIIKHQTDLEFKSKVRKHGMT